MKSDGTRLSPDEFEDFKLELDDLMRVYGVKFMTHRGEHDEIFVVAHDRPYVRFLVNGDENPPG